LSIGSLIFSQPRPLFNLEVITGVIFIQARLTLFPTSNQQHRNVKGMIENAGRGKTGHVTYICGI